MKKSLFPRLALMAVVVALVSACSQKKQEYTDVIPANAHTVVSINLKSLADKAGLNDKENKEVQEKLTNALKSGMMPDMATSNISLCPITPLYG